MRICLLLLVTAPIALSSAIPKHGPISGQYMLRLDESLVQTSAQEDTFVSKLRTEFNLDLQKFYHMRSLKLLFLKGDDADVVRVRQLPEVLYVEQNAYAYAAQCTSQPSPGTWGLDRIDQREQLPYSNPTDSSAVYVHGDRTGTGVVAYICDSGVEYTHPDFGGRASWGYTAIDMDSDQDLNGHGTHCAGTVGSNSYGVAKGVDIVAVKVLTAAGSGPWSSIIDGLDWILADHQDRQASSGVMPKSVVNLSVGGGTYTPVDNAVQSLIDGGVVVVISAMNEDDDACNYSPARLPDAITLGASDVSDWSATFTNWGSCIDLFGPGVSVLSTHLNGGTAVYSGTSMAAPHTAGTVARYMSSLADAPTPQDVTSWLLGQTTPGALTFQDNNHATSPNLLLYANC